MSESSFDRRSFLKAAGLTAAAGALAACGTSSGSAYSKDFGPVRVDISSRLNTSVNSSNDSSSSWYITPTVYFSLTAEGSWNRKYSKLFSASVNGTSLELSSDSSNSTASLSSGIGGFFATTSVPAKPTFAMSEAQCTALKSGKAPFVLRVEPYDGQTVTYTITWGGEITKS